MKLLKRAWCEQVGETISSLGVLLSLVSPRTFTLILGTLSLLIGLGVTELVLHGAEVVHK